MNNSCNFEIIKVVCVVFVKLHHYFTIKKSKNSTLAEHKVNRKYIHTHLHETSVRADVFPASRVCAQVVSEWEGLLS